MNNFLKSQRKKRQGEMIKEHYVVPRIIAFAVILGLIIGTKDSFSVVVDKIVVVVNDEVITQREVAQLLVPLYGQYKKEYTGKRLERKILEAEDKILDQLIDDKLILSEAKGQGIEIMNKEIENKLQNIKDKFETEERFRSALAEQNISLSELRNRLKHDLMKQKLVHKVMGWKVVITPIEVREYYDNYVEDFANPEKAKVLNILIKKEKEGRTKEEARFLIEMIKKLMNKGEEFEVLAREYSEGPNAKKGGSLGLIEKGEMRKEIDNAVFSLAPGEVSDIIESPIGYHIFKVTERIPEEITDFNVVKEEIEELIYRERINKNLKKWLKELRKNAYISIK